MIQKKMVRKKLRGHFGKISDELLYRISSVYKYYIYSTYVPCKDYFFKLMLEDSKKRRCPRRHNKQTINLMKTGRWNINGKVEENNELTSTQALH